MTSEIITEEQPGKIVVLNPAKRSTLLVPIFLFPACLFLLFEAWRIEGSPLDPTYGFLFLLFCVVELFIVWRFFSVTTDTVTLDKSTQAITIEKVGFRKTSRAEKSFKELLQITSNIKFLQSGAKHVGLYVVLTLCFRDGENVILLICDPTTPYLGEPASLLGKHIAAEMNIPLSETDVRTARTA